MAEPNDVSEGWQERSATLSTMAPSEPNDFDDAGPDGDSTELHA
jgi:hypothetical protein